MKVERVSIAIIAIAVLLALAAPASRMFAIAGLVNPGPEAKRLSGMAKWIQPYRAASPTGLQIRPNRATRCSLLVTSQRP